MRSIITLVGLMLAVFSGATYCCGLEKLYSQELDFKQVATALKASREAPAVLVEEGVGSYWLVADGGASGDPDFSIVPIDLGGVSEGATFEHSQWNGDELVFFSSAETIVYDLKRKAVVSRLAVKPRVGSDYHYWLGQRQGRISGTRLLEGENASGNEPDEPPHTPQTALVVAEQEGVYFTAGYHDQTVKKWSLDTGRIVESWTLGRWYSSRRITDLRLLEGQLLAASSKGKVEALSTDDASVKWSASLCNTAPYFLPVGVSSRAEEGVFYRCEGEPEYGYIEKEGESWRHKPMHRTVGVIEVLVDAVALKDEERAILAFESGLVAAVNVRTGQVEQELEPASGDNMPSLIAYNPDRDQLFVITQGDTLSVYRLGSGGRH